MLNKAIIYYALEKFNKIGRDLHKNFYYEIDTNGVFLTKTFLKKFSNLYVSITLSLSDDHNTHRGNGQNHDFFSDIINNLKNVASVFDDTNFRLSLRYNVHHNNILDFELFVKFVKNLHIKCFIDAENVDNYPYTPFHNNMSDIEFLQWKATDYIDILLRNGFAVEELPYVSLGRQCAAVHDVGCKMWADGSVGICDFEKFSERLMIESEKEFSCSYLFDILNKKRLELPEMCLKCYDYPYCGGKKICFDCNGVYKQKRMHRLRIKRYLMRNGILT